MAKIDEYVDKYKEELISKTNVKSVDSKLLYAVAKSCGPSIFKRDSSLVSIRDKKEIERIKKSFLIKKLGLRDGKYLDSGIQVVSKQIGISNRKKYRAMFYYLLVKHFNVGSIFITDKKDEKPLDQLASFGEEFLNSQKNIDSEIRLATDKNFGDLLL